MILECIVENEKDAIQAERLGINRLELVSAMSEGGLTPSYGTVKRVMEAVKIPVQVMLRPHSYSFEYDELDWMSMREDLQAFSDLGVKGIVFGCLKNGEVDSACISYTPSCTLSPVIGLMPSSTSAFDLAMDELGATSECASSVKATPTGATHAHRKSAAASMPAISANSSRKTIKR